MSNDWDGEGNPPVGEPVLFQRKNLSHLEIWEQCEILAYYGDYVVVGYFATPKVWRLDGVVFKPDFKGADHDSN